MASSARHWAIAGYAVATGFQALAGFLALPIVTRLLGPDEFGLFSLWEPLGATIAPFALLGLNHGLLKLVGEDRLSPSLVFRRLLPAAMGLLVLAMAMIALASVFRSDLRSLLMPMACLVAAEGILGLCLAAARSANRSLDFAAMSVLKTGAYLAIVWAAFWLGTPAILSSSDLLMWMAASSGLAAAFGLARVLGQPARADGGGSPRLVTSAMHYGLPITGSAALSAVAVLGDRYVLTHWIDRAEIGQYVVVLKMAAALNFIVMPLNMWFPAARFQHVRDVDGGDAFFRRTSFAVLVVLMTVASALILSGPTLLHILNPRQTWNAALATMLLATVLVNGMTATMNLGLLSSGRTHWLLWASVGALIVQYALFFALIPVLGSLGAAAATLAGAVISLVAQHVLSQSAHPVKFAYRSMAAAAALLSAATVLAMRLPLWVGMPAVLGATTALWAWWRRDERR